MIDKVLNRIERRFRRFGINNLMAYIMGITALVYFINMSIPGGVTPALTLNSNLVLNGEVWRLFTFIFIPPARSPLFAMIAMYLYYLIGTALENEWGSFKFTLYYIIGVLGTVLAAFITGGFATANYINMSLFLAFAVIYPDFTLRLFFMIPVKVKYLGMLSGAFLVLNLITSHMSERLFILVALANFILFFGEYFFKTATTKTKAASRRREFYSKTKAARNKPIHRCAVCGKTEEDDPELEFRYCSKCDGDYEYCMDHLKNHEHVKSDD